MGLLSIQWKRDAGGVWKKLRSLDARGLGDAVCAFFRRDARDRVNHAGQTVVLREKCAQLRLRIYDSSLAKITGDKVYRGAWSYEAERRHSVGGIAPRERVHVCVSRCASRWRVLAPERVGR